MSIHESGEMYLESIHVLLQQRGQIRSIDVSEYMGFSKPSVSRAMGLLKKGGYILVDKDGYISLTEEGLDVAEKIYERHTFLSNYLIRLGVSKETAMADACKMEHDISQETLECAKAFLARQAGV